MGEDMPLMPDGATPGNAALMTSSDSDAPHRKRRRRRQRQQLGVLTLVQPLMLAVGIFCIATGASTYLFPRTKITRQPPPQPFREQELTSTTRQCATPKKVVMQGADLTSYFSLEPGAAAIFGVAEHESVYNGYRFWFASEANKSKFEERPLTYMPSWGGFCSWGISRESWWTKEALGPDADPNEWFITDDGNLHFFRSELPKSKFMGDVKGNVQAGDIVWHSWWHGAEPGADLADGSPLDTNCFCSPDKCEDN